MNAQNTGDTAKLEELETKLESLLDQEAKVLQEEAALTQDMKTISKAEVEAAAKLVKDKNDLASLRGDDACDYF